MNQIRLMQILKVTVANLCDVANGCKIDTDMLWGLYRELSKEIITTKTELGKG